MNVFEASKARSWLVLTWDLYSLLLMSCLVIAIKWLHLYVCHCTTTATIIASYVNYIHLAISYDDTMTYRGHLMAIFISIINDHIFYKLTSIKLAKCKIIISYICIIISKVKSNFLYINIKDNKTMLVFSQPLFSKSKVYK
jgi:hypothetical protein